MLGAAGRGPAARDSRLKRWPPCRLFAWPPCWPFVWQGAERDSRHSAAHSRVPRLLHGRRRPGARMVGPGELWPVDCCSGRGRRSRLARRGHADPGERRACVMAEDVQGAERGLVRCFAVQRGGRRRTCLVYCRFLRLAAVGPPRSGRRIGCKTSADKAYSSRANRAYLRRNKGSSGGPTANLRRSTTRSRNTVERRFNRLRQHPYGRDPTRQARAHLPGHRRRRIHPHLATRPRHLIYGTRPSAAV